MDLLHAFVKTSAFTISEDAAIGDVFSGDVVDIAMKQQFVLHAMLCLTALHRAATCLAVDTLAIASLLDVAAEHQTLSVFCSMILSRLGSPRTSKLSLSTLASCRFPYGASNTPDYVSTTGMSC